MKKSILNIGKALNKAEQKQIQGGNLQCRLECYNTCYAQSGGDRMVYANCLDQCLPNCN